MVPSPVRLGSGAPRRGWERRPRARAGEIVVFIDSDAFARPGSCGHTSRPIAVTRRHRRRAGNHGGGITPGGFGRPSCALAAVDFGGETFVR
jgi:hypothetical protein